MLKEGGKRGSVRLRSNSYIYTLWISTHLLLLLLLLLLMMMMMIMKPDRGDLLHF